MDRSKPICACGYGDASGCGNPTRTWEEAAKIALRTGVWPKHYLRVALTDTLSVFHR